MSPSSSPARLVRAVSVGVWVTFGSVAAHLLGEGSLPSLVALVPVVVAATVTTWWVGRRQITLPVALALLSIPQIAVHVLVSYVHGHAMVPSTLMVAAHVLSTVVTGLLIAHAERLWWSLWEVWSARWQPLSFTTPLIGSTFAVSAGVSVPTTAGLRHCVSRRGPPCS